MKVNYRAFLIRFERLDDSLPWRAFLKDVATGETKSFANEHELMVYMRDFLGSTNQSPEVAESGQAVSNPPADPT